jgi:hypothetical protein
MYGVFIFLIIAILAVYFSRKNFKDRYTMIRNNLQNFNNEIKQYYYNLPKENQEEFARRLNLAWKPNFESILNGNYNYAKNIWSLQQQISQQQELFSELASFAKERSEEK